MAQINNWDLKSNIFFCEGILKSIGYYAGEHQQDAYEILGIEGELDVDEWCDIVFSEEPFKLFAVFGDSEVTCTSGDFYFYEITPEHPKYTSLIECFYKNFGENYFE